MYLAHDSERNLFPQVADIDVRIFQGRAVVEHQEQARERQYKEKKECDSTHAPRVAHADTRLSNLHRMQVKKDAAEHHEHAFAVRVRHAHAEDGSINLTFLDLFADFRRREIL